MAKILMILPETDFDPTESSVPWKVLTDKGHSVFFATPHAQPAQCDQNTLLGIGLGGMLKTLAAKPENVAIYRDMERSENFQNPMAWADIKPNDYDGLILPGGHAPGMKPYLESERVFNICKDFFARQAPVASICHGVLALARSQTEDGKSILRDYQVTGLNNFQENIAYKLTKKSMGTHYRTYKTSVQDEVSAVLAKPGHFKPGPILPSFGSARHPQKGFVVKDRNLISARWPGDAYKLAYGFADMLTE